MNAAAPIPLPVVERFFPDLSESEVNRLGDALDGLPAGPTSKGVSQLWRKYEQGTVGLFVASDPAGRLLAASFFQVEDLPNGRSHFAVLATVSLAPDVNCTDVFLPQVEEAARKLHCDVLTIRTTRPGLVRRLVNGHGWQATEIILSKTLS